MKSKTWVQKTDWILIVEVAIVCIMVLPILGISLYVIPSGDDFTNIAEVKTSLLQYHTYISAAVSQTVYYYKNISGYFFGAFLNFYVSPFLRGGIKALRATVFFLNLFFYSSLYFFVEELLKFFYNVKNRKVSVLVYVLILFAFINNQYNSEMITWYCTLIGYAFVVACMFWGIIFFLKALKSDKLYQVILASLLGFLASGDALNVTALNCGIYLLISYIAFTQYKKKKIALICFVSALTGGVINAVAPGNFIRHGSSSYPIAGALKTSFYYGKEQIQELLFYSPFVILLCILFVLAIKFIHDPRPIKTYHLFVFAGIICLGIVIVNFPVCLGYTVDYFPDRCVWVENCVIYLGSFSWTVCFAEWLKSKYKDLEIRKETLICIFISFVLYGCNFCAVRDISDYPTIDMIKQLSSGEIADYAEFWNGVFEEIENSVEDEVIIYREEIKKNPFIRWPQITEDKNNYRNECIAMLYGKKSVIIITGNDEGT